MSKQHRHAATQPSSQPAPASEQTATGEVSPSLSDALDELKRNSPTLGAALDDAQEDDILVRFGESGAGTFFSASSGEIVLDPASDASTIASSLAHELGHAVDELEYAPLGSSMDDYVSGNTWEDLSGEAEATIMELKVRDELLAAGADDPGISGHAAEKLDAWEAYKTHGDRDMLVRDISHIFAELERPSTSESSSYWDYYANHHGKNFNEYEK